MRLEAERESEAEDHQGVTGGQLLRLHPGRSGGKLVATVWGRFQPREGTVYLERIILAAILVIPTIAASQQQQPSPRARTPLAAPNVASPNGRYVFGQVSDFRRDQYMLDTQTGRLWVVVTRKDSSGNDSQLLQPLPYDAMDEKDLNRLSIFPR
jgi:hypothetical protein